MSEITQSYLVTWKIDIEADSPEAAAAQALIVQRDEQSQALVFEITDEAGGTTEVDLSE